MKKSLVIKGLIAILIISLIAIMSVGCGSNGGNNSNDNGTSADKSALNAELALEESSQGDYTADSYNAYAQKLANAKNVLNNASATQADVDRVTTELSAARLNLALRSVEAIKDANKNITMNSGEIKEISIADYVNVNSLSKISYKVMVNKDVVTLGTVTDGKFTVTAGEVIGEVEAKVSINVYYDGASKLTLDLTINVVNIVSPTLISNEVTRKYDLVTLGNKENIVLDFSENVNNVSGVALNYLVKNGNEELILNGSRYTFAFKTYTEEMVYETFNVTISYIENGETKTLEYTYKLGLRDTGRYSVVNGNFENGLEGWTFTNTFGDAPFAGIDEKPLYWIQNFPMNNVGSYFSAYADGALEVSQGTLASTYFVVNSEYATYMLGGAGNPGVYITIEDKDGNVLALYRNTMFADLPEEVTDFDAQRELVGNTVFLANFVTYKVDIAQWMGEEIRFVVHDHASENWGVVFFDELNTYYASVSEISENAVLAENLLADRSALLAELELEVAEQGDFTLDSFNAYLEKLAAAKEIVESITADQDAVNAAAAALTEARLALAVRPVEEIFGGNKSFTLICGNTQEIIVADYVNTNGLGNITFEIKASDAAAIISSVTDGKFVVKAGEVSEEKVVTVTISALYNGTEKLAVELTFAITNDLAPIVEMEEIVKSYDIYELDNKSEIIIDLSENVNNIGNIELSYSVGGVALNSSLYTFTLGDYTDEITYESFTVTVSYIANGKVGAVSYTYKLGLKNTAANRLENGGFENGLDGWVVVGNIGNVNSDTHYWLNDPENAEGYAFGMDGEMMFSAYAPGALESSVGALTSSTFKLGGSGFITFKVGAMRDENYVYVDVVDAETKVVLARYYNGLWADRTADVKSGCTLIAYKADLSAFLGREVFFRISDNAESGYGLFFADSFVTYYENEPMEGFNVATPVSYNVSGTIYDVFNGGFEMGDVQGWWNDGETGVVTNASGFWADDIPYGKDGEYLFTGVESFGADTMREENRGVLTSSIFEIGGTGYISFKLGGGGNVLCYVQVIDAVTGEILARYHQQAMNDAVLVQYVADLSAYIGRTARIQVVDQAASDWGCVSFDNVVTYYPEGAILPEGITANDIKGALKYTIENGSFESGNIDGWTMNVTEAGNENTLGWVLETEMDAVWYTKNDDTKEGTYLFTFVQPGDINCENSMGTLQSSTFSLKHGSFVSFKFGAAGNAQNHDVYIELCRADGSVIARFYNDAPDKINTKMNSYYYQYDGVEVECFFRVVDNSTGDYGCLVIDDFRVNLDAAPEGYIAAIQ